jgi:hypothetical protein
MSEPKKELDVFEQKRDAEREKVEKCQSDKGHNSCLVCPEVVGCEIRKRYVVAVYESMSKGAGGGFEF